MGCFSFLSTKSGKAALSTSFDGSPCYLFLLKDGKVLEYMHGNYDSYGRVFDGKGSSFEWKMDWGSVCGLMSNPNDSNGIAMLLEDEWKEGDPFPTKRSKDDPNQGWGDDGELMGDCSSGGYTKIEKPYHKIIRIVRVEKLKKIVAGKYTYKGYKITCHGYYHPERRVVWEAINLETDTGDFRGFSLKEIKSLIDLSGK